MRDRYIVILNTKTVSVTDIIDAEEAIRLITAEIESKEGRLRFLNDPVALSPVKFTIYEKVKYSDAPERFEKDYSDQASDSFGMGWQPIKMIGLVFIALWPIFFDGLDYFGNLEAKTNYGNI